LSDFADLFALEADVVGVSFHGVGGRVLVRATACPVQPFVLESHQGLALHVLVQLPDRRQQLRQCRVVDVTLKNLHTKMRLGQQIQQNRDTIE
jgi:hypothetical protein